MLDIIPILKYISSTYKGEKIIEVLLSTDNRVIIDTDYSTYISHVKPEEFFLDFWKIWSDYILQSIQSDLNLKLKNTL